MADQSYLREKGAEMFNSNELKRKKRMKLVAYAAAFAIFQTIVILVFSLTVMRVKSPKFRLRSITVEDLIITSSPNSPSFNMRFNAEVAVKNTNFGRFKFGNTTISFDYGGAQVGEAFIAKGKAKARSTKNMNVTVDLNSNNMLTNSSLERDISSGVLTLTTNSKLSGKVHLMKLIKKNKSATMNCTLTVNLMNRAIQDIKCH